MRSGAAGNQLLALSGDALAAAILPFGGGGPTTTVPVSSTVVAYVDVVLPRSAGRAVPKRVRNRITYTFPPGAPVEAVIGSTTVRGPELRVDRQAPIVIAPPLRGGGWVSGNGCCGDASVNHRSTILSANGTYVAPETFAVDYVRVVDGRIYDGDGTQNADWLGYGVPVRAATSGRVVSAVDDRPEVPPFTTTDDNATVTEPSQFGGNGVVVKIRPGVFGHYYHLQPGSVRVEVGERVRTGQKLGLFGNSGNTTGPHLHFGINDGRNPLTSEQPPVRDRPLPLRGHRRRRHGARRAHADRHPARRAPLASARHLGQRLLALSLTRPGRAPRPRWSPGRCRGGRTGR